MQVYVSESTLWLKVNSQVCACTIEQSKAASPWKQAIDRLVGEFMVFRSVEDVWNEMKRMRTDTGTEIAAMEWPTPSGDHGPEKSAKR